MHFAFGSEYENVHQISTARKVAAAISLLDQYFAEDLKRAKAGLGFYVEWLKTHRRQDLADLIRSNAYVTDTLRDVIEQYRA
jgi:hypothetical protein